MYKLCNVSHTVSVDQNLSVTSMGSLLRFHKITINFSFDKTLQVKAKLGKITFQAHLVAGRVHFLVVI